MIDQGESASAVLLSKILLVRRLVQNSGMNTDPNVESDGSLTRLTSKIIPEEVSENEELDFLGIQDKRSD